MKYFAKKIIIIWLAGNKVNWIKQKINGTQFKKKMISDEYEMTNSREGE